MAHAGHQDRDDVQEAFSAAAKTLTLGGLQLVAENEISLSDLDLSLEKLAQLKPLAKPLLLRACAASVMHDEIISPMELELLRTFSDVLDCPMPPIIPS